MPEIGVPDDFNLAAVGPGIGEPGRPQVRFYVLDLSVARQDFKVDLAGRFLWAQTSNSPSAQVDIKYNDPSGQAIPFQRGTSVAGLPFASLYVSNVAQPNTQIVLTSSMTIINVNNAVSQIVATFTIPGTPQTATRAALTNGSATLLSASNANKRGTFIEADKGNSIDILLGDVNVNANGFGELSPGDIVFIETSGALYAFVGGPGQFARVWDLYL